MICIKMEYVYDIQKRLSNHFIENINIFLEMHTHHPNALIHTPLL